MIRVTYISIENFKIFGRNIRVDLTNPTVLVGPNNSGKTSVLQAFALWSLGIKAWNMQKGKSNARIRYGVPINRLNLSQLPVQNARFLWNNCEVRRGSTEQIPVIITVGLEIDGELYDCPIEFTQNNSELIYCKPKDFFVDNNHVLQIAVNMQVNLLYSMSGIAIEEVRLPKERVNYLMGQGMTSEVLRNLCFTLYEDSPEDWKNIVKWMDKLFGMKIQSPKYIETKGALELTYRHHNSKRPLDIASAGRGALQILLLLTYMCAHKSSIILVDEPDAHLEIIKQRTVYALLNEIANANNIQLIIATHSEVILNEAIDNSIAMILEGEVKSISLSNKAQDIRPLLKDFGVEHFYKASITKNILYVEGSTDIQMLKAFAKLMKREKVVSIFDGELNCYYTQNSGSENSIDNIVERKEGYYSNFVRHFSIIKKMIPDFVGLGILDSDGKSANKQYPEGLKVIVWERYELENYFVSINVLDRYFEVLAGGTDHIYYQFYLQAKEFVILKYLFDDGQGVNYTSYSELSKSMKDALWKKLLKDVKMSKFVDDLMDKFVEVSDLPYPMRKGEYYKLVSYMAPNEVDSEIVAALDAIEEILS